MFGLWTLKEDDAESTKENKRSWGPLITIVLALFLAEMGDKTQLATVAYAVKYNATILTLLGVVAGMVLADALGIYVGVIAGKRIPKKVIKWLSAFVFISFGLVGLYMR